MTICDKPGVKILLSKNHKQFFVPTGVDWRISFHGGVDSAIKLPRSDWWQGRRNSQGTVASHRHSTFQAVNGRWQFRHVGLFGFIKTTACKALYFSGTQVTFAGFKEIGKQVKRPFDITMWNRLLTGQRLGRPYTLTARRKCSSAYRFERERSWCQFITRTFDLLFILCTTHFDFGWLPNQSAREVVLSTASEFGQILALPTQLLRRHLVGK